MKAIEAQFSDNARQVARYTLFVEGKISNEASSPPPFDQAIVSRILRDIPIRTVTMGASHNIKAAAQTLFYAHPDYFFLIDRDHYNDNIVEKSWETFPNPDTYNLLIWRKREIENYFLDPDYLAQSKYMSCSKDKLQGEIIKHAKMRLYMDCANLVITYCRETMKINWIKHFEKKEDFADEKAAINNLFSKDEFKNKCELTNELLDPKKIEEKFYKYLSDATGDKTELEFGRGKWMDMLCGKEILKSVINDSCFRNVRGYQGDKKLVTVALELLTKPADHQPSDFQRLRNLIISKTSEN